jgi:diketogulonate reductase-like aldo/keto reductase
MLRRLGTDYLDLLYIHHPWPDAPWREALPQIDGLIEEGVVRHLGVSNFAAAQLREASTLADHRIAANQIRFSCSQRKALDDELSHLCRVNGTSVVAYRPLDQGDLAANGIITDIAKRRQATPAQIALAWLVAKQTLPIPRASRLDHVTQNAAAIDIQLSTDDIVHIDRSF